MRKAADHFYAGVALLKQGKRVEALAEIQAGLVLDPSNVMGWTDRCTLLYTMGFPFEALCSIDRAIQLKPKVPELHSNRSACLMSLDAPDLAEQATDKALKLAQGNVFGLANKANILHIRGAHLEAAEFYTRALKTDPPREVQSKLHLYRGFAYLAAGRLKEGWADNEWRHSELEHYDSRIRVADLWKGGPYTTMLVTATEQGFGDNFQFSRYAPLLKRLRGGKVYLEVRRTQVRVMQTMPGIDGVVALGDPWPEGVDAVVPAMTLPHLLGTDTVEDIPWDGPYLSGDKARFASPNDGTLRVGLCWAGQSRPDARMAEVDRRRSVRLEQMAPLAKVPGVRFVSLQIGDGLSQVIAPPGMHVQDYSQSLEDFYDTACLIATLDLVISVDTAVAHLAAAMGKPVWLLSRFDNCWRWLGKRADSPWYPSLVQFCQPRWGDWEPVMMEVARKLSALTALRVAV